MSDAKQPRPDATSGAEVAATEAERASQQPAALVEGTDEAGREGTYVVGATRPPAKADPAHEAGEARKAPSVAPESRHGH